MKPPGVLRRLLVSLLCLTVMAALPTIAWAAQDERGASSRFFDPGDGWLDISSFLDTAYGFVPLVAPITEPAVGYGAAGTLIFIDRNVPGEGQRFARPNIAAVGGVATENGTRGLFAGHMGNWLDGDLRTLVGVADADINLDFFGLGGDRLPGGNAIGYSVAARGGLVGASYRIAKSPFWVGLRYVAATTNVTPNLRQADAQRIPSADLGLHLAALTPALTLDTRNNFFTPTEGSYVELSDALFRTALGSDRDFDIATLTAIHYRPLARPLYFGVRGTASSSSSGTPFYLRPFVVLRGVQALRYQGDQAGEVEAELRWQFHPRFSLVGFGGAGIARSQVVRGEDQKTVTSGGAGFRYLIAREYGLNMGLDVGFGPDGPILYVVFGNAWMRP